MALFDTWGGSWGSPRYVVTDYWDQVYVNGDAGVTSGSTEGLSWGTSWSRLVEEAAPPEALEQPRGTVGWLYGRYAPGDRRRTSTDILRDRERFGIPPAASAVISAVAHRQVATLQTDAQKRFEELSRELELRGLEWKAAYLEELTARIDRLITIETAARLKAMQIQKDEEALVLLIAMAV